MMIMELVIFILLIAVIIIQQYLHHAERKDLYNRIMAKDLTEYKHEKSKPIKNMIRQAMQKNLEQR